MFVTAYMTRGMQLLLGSSKRAMIERAEETGAENDAIPLTNLQSPIDASRATSATAAGRPFAGLAPAVALTQTLPLPQRAQDPSQVRGTGGPPVASPDLQDLGRPSTPRQVSLPLTRSQRWAAIVGNRFDTLIYTSLFLFVGIPVYYVTGYAMPAHLTCSILSYFAALSLPAPWRKVFHPVLVSSLITVLGVWILGLIRGDSLDQVLAVYQTKTKYLQLWEGTKGLPAPGAGDIFASVLDASIVALALPMFQYRKELMQHFFAIVIPNTILSIATLFGYPPLCYAIGISASRSLAFGARSLTLALARPAVSNLGGDLNTVAAIAIMSGILGALLGSRLLRYFKISEGRMIPLRVQKSYDDYVTRGVTLGANSSAIATATLLQIDPRAAALSCLSMSLFGIITVALTSIPPVVVAVRSLVQL
ncbi:MAG: hypothetical protein M1818_007133 [Claussenomyces sp. TS43310]|nr:MAG: hypothetical protein M1818_007133 [Claussenomyces sp. TS43310]